MTEDIASEVQGILEEAWEGFKNYYDELAPKNAKQQGLNQKEAQEAHWICWNEYDLMFHVGRLFYNILETKNKKDFSNIQIHFEKNATEDNFKDSKFEDRFKNLKEKLDMKKGPKIDMIISYEDCEDKDEPFLLCAELKYFHGRQYEKPIDQINRDINKLKAIKSCEIAKKAVFILFDDYYFYADTDISSNITNEINKINNEKEILILFANTEAKLKEYK